MTFSTRPVEGRMGEAFCNSWTAASKRDEMCNR